MGAALAFLQAAQALSPLIIQALPALQALLRGTAPSDTDMAALEAATAALTTQADAAERAAGAV